MVLACGSCVGTRKSRMFLRTMYIQRVVEGPRAGLEGGESYALAPSI